MIEALQNIHSLDTSKRAEAIITLGILGKKEKDLEHTLQGFTHDSSEDVRVAAHYALALWGDAGSAQALLDVLGHTRTHLRKLAYSALVSVYPDLPGLNPQKPEDAYESIEQGRATQERWHAWWEKNQKHLTWDSKKKIYSVSCDKNSTKTSG